jgi:hypothetical protein
MLARFRKANPLRSTPAGRDFAAGFLGVACACGVHNHKQVVKSPEPKKLNALKFDSDISRIAPRTPFYRLIRLSPGLRFSKKTKPAPLKISAPIALFDPHTLSKHGLLYGLAGGLCPIFFQQSKSRPKNTLLVTPPIGLK